jgi:hypothetical protein
MHESTSTSASVRFCREGSYPPSRNYIILQWQLSYPVPRESYRSLRNSIGWRGILGYQPAFESCRFVRMLVG